MRNSINYLKFDFRIIQKSSKQFLISLMPFVIFMFWGNSFFGVLYLFLFLLILGGMPFSIQSNEKSTEMYYMFPAKASNMVLGRFLYLICLTLIIFIVDGIIMTYLYKMNKLDNLEVLSICLGGIMSLISCFIQYPLYYKFDIKNMGIISSIIQFIPACFVYILPSHWKENNSFKNLIFSNGDKITLMLLSLLIIIFMGYVSYIISCRICKNKEI